MNAADLTVWLAFGAGFLSFLSPCCLPLYPSYLAYVTGVSVKDLEEGVIQRNALLHTLFFILGFSIIFFALGMSAGWIGELFTSNRSLISKSGGVLVTMMGLVMLGIFKPRWLMQERRLQLRHKPAGYLGSALVGITYAAGWTPCVGPILSAVLTLGITQPDRALIYLTAYTLGFALPFFLMAFFVGKVKWIVNYSHLAMKIGGAIMALTGVLLYTGQLTRITAFLIRLYGGFTGF